MKRQLASNVAWNWAGMLTNMLTGFVVAPYLVHRLGDTVYGLWILVASMSGYFGLLDLGVRGSVGRYVAYYRARNEHEEVNRTISTALSLLCGVGLLSLIATGIVLLLFFHIFEVPPEYAGVTRAAILIIGINLALTFPVSAFDGVLWGHERFDLINAIDIPTALLRTALTFAFVHGPADILALAWITLVTSAGNELVKLAAAFRVNPLLRLSISRFAKAHARELYGYGFWQFLLQIARQIAMQIGPLVIGGLISVAAVTPYSIASRLLGYASQFMVAATGVLTPLATALHAKQDGVKERLLFIEGGKWCTAFALFAGICLVCLGKPFLELWMGKATAATSLPPLIVLTAGELLAMSQWLTYSIILGKARHRAVAIASVTEGIVAGIGGALAAPRFGVMGVCTVFAIAAFACRGVFQVVYSCRIVGIPIGQYLWQAIAWPVAAAAIPGALLLGAIWYRLPGTWPELMLWGCCFSILYFAVVFVALGGLRFVSWPRMLGWGPAIGEKVHG